MLQINIISGNITIKGGTVKVQTDHTGIGGGCGTQYGNGGDGGNITINSGTVTINARSSVGMFTGIGGGIGFEGITTDKKCSGELLGEVVRKKE